MISLSLNLTFNGQCEEAFKFYEKCLGGKINIKMTWGESPMGNAFCHAHRPFWNSVDDQLRKIKVIKPPIGL